MFPGRHPTTSKRPKFENIVDLLAASDMEVLDRQRDSKEQQLGGPLEWQALVPQATRHLHALKTQLIDITSCLGVKWYFAEGD